MKTDEAENRSKRGEKPPRIRVVEVGPDGNGGGWVVVEKPSGLRSVPGLRGDSDEGRGGSVLAQVGELFPEASGPLICHRLDQPTSGLMVLGLDSQTHRALSMDFEFRRVLKRYVALVEGGEGGRRAGVIDLPIRPDFQNRPWQMVDRHRGRPARTRWGRIGMETVGGQRASRLMMEPLTGRTHQLRIHCGHPAEDGGLGCPILGDELYGDPRTFPRLCLHAARLGFADPATGEWRQFDSPAAF